MKRNITKMLKLSVLIPAYNEENTILRVLERVKEQSIKGVEIETVVVDDGSNDNTLELLKSNPSLYNKLVALPENLGKGGAVKKGLSEASGDYILFQDADLEYDPSEYASLLVPVSKHGAEVVIGSRLMSSPYTRVHYFWHKIGNHLITLCFNIVNNTTFTDIYSCHLLFKAELIKPKELKELGWAQHAEILTLAVKRGKIFYEVPISYHGRTYEEGKKIRAHHTLGVFKTIIFKGLFSK